MSTTQTLYDKYCKGTTLTNEEVYQGATFFQQLSELLHKAGPAFVISAKEATRVSLAFKEYARARGIRSVDQPMK